jgi:hypothetical protein
MAGSFATYSDTTGRGIVLRQEVREYPVPWCTGCNALPIITINSLDPEGGDHSKYTISIIGDNDTTNVVITTDFYIEEDSQVDNSSGRVVVGARGI